MWRRRLSLARLRPRPVRSHLPLLAQLARPDDRGRRASARDQLLALANPQAALDAAARRRHPPARHGAVVAPTRSCSRSTRVGSATGAGSSCCTSTSDACVEEPDVEVKFQKGSFKIAGLSIGPLDGRRPDAAPLRVDHRPLDPAARRRRRARRRRLRLVLAT